MREKPSNENINYQKSVKNKENSRNYGKSHLKTSKTLEKTSKFSKILENSKNQSKTIKNYQETSENRHKRLKIV